MELGRLSPLVHPCAFLTESLAQPFLGVARGVPAWTVAGMREQRVNTGLLLEAAVLVLGPVALKRHRVKDPNLHLTVNLATRWNRDPDGERVGEVQGEERGDGDNHDAFHFTLMIAKDWTGENRRNRE